MSAIGPANGISGVTICRVHGADATWGTYVSRPEVYAADLVEREGWLGNLEFQPKGSLSEIGV